MNKPKKDLLSLLELSSDEIRYILQKAIELKQLRLTSGNPSTLHKKTGVLIFEKPSLRTRITFETAIYELGGHPINLPADTIGMGKRESVSDIAKNLERWVHLIIARTFSHDTVVKLARYSSIPVINALTDAHHPCQALAFGQTILEKFGTLQKCNIVFIGDANNVCNSIMVLCAKLGLNFTVVCPNSYTPNPGIMNECLSIAKQHASTITITSDLYAAVKDASAIYTDVWASMGQEHEAEHRKQIFAPYQVNEDVINHAPSHVLISHCLPAHRGEEITSGVLDSKNSIAFDEAENRLHVQKAIILHLFS